MSAWWQPYLRRIVAGTGGAFVLLAALALAGCRAAADENREPAPRSYSTTMHERLATLAEHPRLVLARAAEPGWRERIAADDDFRAAGALVVAAARALEAVPPVTYQLEGRRLLHTSRLVLKRVLVLAVAAQLEPDPAFARRAWREMEAAAHFPDWNPTHFLDTAEMTAALALGYDAFYHALEPAERDTLRDAIMRHGLEPGFVYDGWTDKTNNWNPVCHGGMTLGALAVATEEPALAARVLARTARMVPLALATYAPDGAYPEGPAYWEYGSTYLCLLLACLDTALGDDLGLRADLDGFLASADYRLHVQGPSGGFFNYGDSRETVRAEPALFWLAEYLKRPDLLYYQRPELRAYVERRGFEAHTLGNRFFPLILLLAGPQEPQRPAARHWVGDGVVPVALHRSAWHETATFLGIKGGRARVPHGHRDAGTFVLDALGIRWAEDLGRQSYEPLEAQGLRIWSYADGSDRWKVLRMSTFGHNTLIVNGAQQDVDGRAALLTHQFTSGEGWSRFDLTSAYVGQLALAERTAWVATSGLAAISDHVQALPKVPATVRWQMITPATIEIAEEGRVARLRRDGRTLTVSLLGPAETRFAIEEMDPPPQPWDDPNPARRMLTFTVPLKGGASASWRVGFRPAEVSAAETFPPLD